LAERMVVMNAGIPEQIGTPVEVFEKPASIFVASFIGSPPMNLIPVFVDDEGQVKDEDGALLQFDPASMPKSIRNRKVTMGMRPEHMKLHGSGIAMDVEMVEILGSEQLIHGRHGITP